MDILKLRVDRQILIKALEYYAYGCHLNGVGRNTPEYQFADKGRKATEALSKVDEKWASIVDEELLKQL